MIVLDLSILNQKGTPMFNSDTFANRPAFGIVGRIFISTDTKEFFRDTGTSWELIGGPGSGTITGSGAATQIAFWNSASTITGSNNLWYDSTNSYLGVNTNAPGNPLDVHGNISSVAALNQTTATNNTLLSLLNSGTPLWRIGNFYTAGANDFGIFDVVNTTQQFTIVKATGQTFVGAKTTSSGRLVVNDANSDNHIVIIGATSPSLRINNLGSGPTKQIGIGLSTATNNFIQGSADRDFCMFNGSTTASPILFGIYDAGAGNVQEAARISAARNFLIGTTTDAGYKLDVAGTFHAGTTTDLYYDGANLGLGTLTPVRRLSVNNGAIGIFNTATGQTATDGFVFSINGTDATITNFENTNLIFQINNSEKLRITPAGNLLINTTTDAGQKLQVNGTATIKDTVRVNANSTTSVSTSATQISTGSNTYGGLAIVWGADSGGNIFSDFLYYSLGTFNVLASQNVSGGPAGRTYSVDGSGNLLLTMGSGTYNVRYQGLLTT